jgi:hypothetical protein
MDNFAHRQPTVQPFEKSVKLNCKLKMGGSSEKFAFFNHVSAGYSHTTDSAPRQDF